MKLIGARIIKTGIAVTITMFICRQLNLEPAVFGAVSAVINVQPSVFLTLKAARDQVLIHILGVVVGLAFGYLLGGSALTMGAATMIVIVIYKKLGLQVGIVMGIVTAIFILGSPQTEFIESVLVRSQVIFIGLSAAMLVNILLWPPRYGNLFLDNLKESNEKVVSFFCQAVHDFALLENDEIEEPLHTKVEIQELLAKTREYAEHTQKESQLHKHEDRDMMLEKARKLADYNEALFHRAEHIYELISLRLARRREYGSKPISREFMSILYMLENRCATIHRLNAKLRHSIIDQKAVEPEDVSENFWIELTKMIERWRPKITNSYYVHGLIEMSAVAAEIRWAAREAKKILTENK